MGRDVLSDYIIQELTEAGLFEQEPNPTIPIKKPVKQPVKPMAPKPGLKPAAKSPVAKPAEKNPFSAEPNAPGAPSTAEPKAPMAAKPNVAGAPAPVDPTLQKVQQQVFRIKNRMSKLALKTLIKKFLISHHDFDINVTKNIKDVTTIESFASPFRGDCEALGGALESMKIELEKLEKLIGE